MKKVIKINEQGFFLEDVLLDDLDQTPVDCIDEPCPDGFYLPKWTGTSWIEGKPQAEINRLLELDEINRLKEFLERTDYKTIQRMRETVLGISFSMSEEDYLALEEERQQAVERIRELSI